MVVSCVRGQGGAGGGHCEAVDWQAGGLRGPRAPRLRLVLLQHSVQVVAAPVAGPEGAQVRLRLCAYCFCDGLEILA